ncbi:IS200/IS605 family transposase [Desulfothermus naphthae]
MQRSSEIRTGRHCVFLLHVHLVFATKYRKNIFNEEHLKTLRTIFEKICKDFDAELKEFNGASDHVHLLVEYPPKVTISKLVNSLKGVSSRKLKELHPELKEYYWKNALWSPSYFAGSCGGAPLKIIKQYIEKQKPATSEKEEIKRQNRMSSN